MLADDEGAGAVGGRSGAGGVPLLALAPERVRRCDFGGRRLSLLVFAMLVLCAASRKGELLRSAGHRPDGFIFTVCDAAFRVSLATGPLYQNDETEIKKLFGRHE